MELCAAPVSKICHSTARSIAPGKPLRKNIKKTIKQGIRQSIRRKPGKLKNRHLQKKSIISTIEKLRLLYYKQTE
jgi:hypothetical protein